MNIASRTVCASSTPAHGGVCRVPRRAYVLMIAATVPHVPVAISRAPIGLLGTRLTSSAPIPTYAAIPMAKRVVTTTPGAGSSATATKKTSIATVASAQANRLRVIARARQGPRRRAPSDGASQCAPADRQRGRRRTDGESNGRVKVGRDGRDVDLVAQATGERVG